MKLLLKLDNYKFQFHLLLENSLLFFHINILSICYDVVKYEIPENNVSISKMICNLICPYILVTNDIDNSNKKGLFVFLSAPYMVSVFGENRKQ